ncbi:MAG: hypothetical protein U0269_36885 [Polyangiales bacterium]
MSSLFDELVLSRAVIDRSRPVLEQLRAAAQRDLRAAIIDGIPAPLWAELCVAGACSTAELVAIFEREGHRAALRELVALLDREALVALAERTDRSRAREHEDRWVMFHCALRLAELGAADQAIAVALRFEWLANDSHLLLALCELVDRTRSPPLVERAIALEATQTHSGFTKDLCAMARFADPSQRERLVALCERRVAETRPEQHDVGENAWGWLALAYAQLDRVEDVERCLDRATTSVRSGECDPLSDARFTVEAALALEPNARRDQRRALARRALAAMRERPDEVWPWMVESVATLAPALEAEARALGPKDSEPPSEPRDEPAALDPILDARQCASDARAQWTTRTLVAIRLALAAPTRERPSADEERPPSPKAAARAQRFARAAYERWMRSDFAPRSEGWITTSEGEAITFDLQSRVLDFLTHEEIEALLAHACPDRARRHHLLYLVAQAARGCARNGAVEAMRAHVATIQNYSTTPSLEFELARLLPEDQRVPELRRLFASERVDGTVSLAQNLRLSAWMTEAAFASDELRAVAIEALEAIPSPALAMECLGRLLRCGAHPRADDAQCVERARALAIAWIHEALPSATLSDDLVSALSVIDEARAREAWLRFAGAEPPRLSWPLAVHAFGRAAIEQLERALDDPTAMTDTNDGAVTAPR